MDPDELAHLSLALSFCGSPRFNERNSECHYYLFWSMALSYFLTRRHSAAKIVTTPQFPLSFEQIDEQGDLRKTFRLPDFVCLYLLGAANPDPPRLLADEDWGRTLGDQDIIERLMGSWLLEEGVLAVIVEIK